MPETSIDENNGLVLGKHNIGSPYQAFVIDTEAESMAKQIAPYQELTLGILSLDARHDLATLGKGEAITHLRYLEARSCNCSPEGGRIINMDEAVVPSSLHFQMGM